MKKLTLILLLSLCYLTVFSQSNDLVKTDGITHTLHQAHVGRITFMNGNIPLDQYKESDFLTSFELKPVSDLNIRPFLANSITNYLHQLAPELNEEELNNKGNYQFSFL